MGRRAWAAGVMSSAMAIAGLVGLSPAHSMPSSPSVGCSWTLKLNGMHGLNAGWPDNASSYWYSQYATIPGARVVIHGQYPAARFFTIDVYDAKANPDVPDFLDATLQPDPGSRNPYTTPGVKGPQFYTAYVVFGPAPANPAPNTIYVADTVDGSPNPGGLMTLRVYLPDDPTSDTGGVALPSMALQLPGGAVVPLQPCPTPDQLAIEPALRQAITQLGWPDQLPAATPFPLAKNPPVWTATTNPDLDNLLGSTAPLPPGTPKTGVGLLTTPNNSYIATRISRQYGQVFVLHAKAPTSPDTQAGQWVGTPLQLRYWSVCEFSTTSGQTVACLADHQIVRDPDGYFTVVISDPADRPANAPNWLPVGGLYEGWPTLRQFLPDPTFKQAIENIAPGADLPTAMGVYYPVSGYCSTATFEQGGVAACLAS
jgi:hypothetical protein